MKLNEREEKEQLKLKERDDLNEFEEEQLKLKEMEEEQLYLKDREEEH